MFAFFGVLERVGFGMWVLFCVLACSGLGGEMGKGCVFCFFFQVSKLGLTIGFSGGISPLLQEFSLNRLIPTLLCDFPGTDICCLNHVGGMFMGSLCNHSCLSSSQQFELRASDDIIKLLFLPAYVLK